MYIGRIVALGSNSAGTPAVLYRVSSRSFPNREAVTTAAGVSIVPKAGFERDILRNPYIAYSGLVRSQRYAVASNGSHTDIIANKLNDGLAVRDAIAQTLVAMDYEHDELDTPRIAAVMDPLERFGYLGAVSRENIFIRKFSLTPGKLWFISTYELIEPKQDQAATGFDARDAASCCAHIMAQGIFADFPNAVSAAAAIWTSGGWDVAAHNLE